MGDRSDTILSVIFDQNQPDTSLPLEGEKFLVGVPADSKNLPPAS